MIKKHALDDYDIEEVRKYLAAKEADRHERVEAFRKHVEDKGRKDFGDDWSSVTGVRIESASGGRKGAKAPVLYDDKKGTTWSGRGVPPKAWDFLYKNGKALPPADVKAALNKKGYALAKPFSASSPGTREKGSSRIS